MNNENFLNEADFDALMIKYDITREHHIREYKQLIDVQEYLNVSPIEAFRKSLEVSSQNIPQETDMLHILINKNGGCCVYDEHFNYLCSYKRTYNKSGNYTKPILNLISGMKYKSYIAMNINDVKIKWGRQNYLNLNKDILSSKLKNL